MTAVIVAFMVGIPVAPEVDHDDDHAHLENAHGGHEHVLMVDEGRVPVSGFDLVGWPVTTMQLVIREPALRTTIDHHDVRAPRGRDPPTARLPRPPPTPQP